jgi:hypothetical protein
MVQVDVSVHDKIEPDNTMNMRLKLQQPNSLSLKHKHMNLKPNHARCLN